MTGSSIFFDKFEETDGTSFCNLKNIKLSLTLINKEVKFALCKGFWKLLENKFPKDFISRKIFW